MKKMYLFPLFICFFSCSKQNDKDQSPKPYSKIWESKDKIKKERSFRVIKDQEQVVGYIDEEYVNKIFNKVNEEQVNTITEKTETKSTPVKKLDTHNIRKTQIQQPKTTPLKKNAQIQQDVHVNKVSNSPSTTSVTSTPTLNKREIDFTKLNFYYSDLKVNKSGMSGSFKINLKNSNTEKLPEDFFHKLICQIEILEGDDKKITLTNYNDQQCVSGQSLWMMKNSFHRNLSLMIKFCLTDIKGGENKNCFSF